ncbi:MAG: hypothetical protein ACK4OM_02220 [Alphaproteobacteria bacterium]
MTRFLKILTMFLFYSNVSNTANIIPANNFKIIEREIYKADKDVLIIFDVDAVLIIRMD